MIEKVSLSEKLSLVTDHWRPKIVGEDELFLGINGRFGVEFRDHVVDVGPGEFLIVPRGVEHRTSADEEAHVLIFEPAATRNTGNVEDTHFTAPSGVRI